MLTNIFSKENAFNNFIGLLITTSYTLFIINELTSYTSTRAY